MPSLPTLFVTGASGKLGRQVIEALLEKGYSGRIIAGTRDPSKLAGLPGVEVRKADFTDPAGLAGAFEGVDRLLIISTSQPNARLAGHLAAVEAAKAAGVKELLYTSMPTPEPPSAIGFAFEHYGTEQAIKASGLPYTILRINWYADNLLGTLPGVIASGKWYTSAGEGRVSNPTRRDAARAAAGALLRPSASEVCTVTGPEALTTAQTAAIASEVTGRPIEVVNVSDEQLAAGAKAAGVPASVADHFIVPFDRNTRENKVGMVTDAVERFWGSKPESLRDFLAANRAALVPSA